MLLLQDLSNWMANLPDAVRSSKNLTELSIPGSHNSGTYMLSQKLPVGPDEKEIVQKLGNNPILGRLTKMIMYRWARCQHADIPEQLKLGIRYFDVRLGQINGQYRILHGLYGPEIHDILKETRAFTTNHPGEVVILDFQHFFDCSDADHKAIIGLIRSAFGSKLIEKKQANNLTLAHLKTIDQSVMIIYRNAAVMASDHDFLWPGSFCPNPWANTMNVGTLFQFLDRALDARSKTSLFVTQAILTPQIKTVLKKPFGSLFEVTKVCNHRLPKWLETQAAKLEPNIIMTDFVANTQISSTIVKINEKIDII